MRGVKFVCVCLMALMASSGYASMKFGKMPVRPVPDLKETPALIKTTNKPLKRAMEAHNLLTDIPGLEDLLDTLDMMERNRRKINQLMEQFQKCGKHMFGDKFKNSDEVLSKAVDEYKEERKKLEEEYKLLEEEDAIVPLSVKDKGKLTARKSEISRGVFRNIEKNPQKYGVQFVDKNAEKNLSLVNEDEEPGVNVLESIAQTEMAMNNEALSRQDIERVRNEAFADFEKHLQNVGLEYKDMDLKQHSSLAKVRADLLKVKELAIKEAEDHIAQLDAQDLEHPDLIVKRTYRSKPQRRISGEVQSAFPGVMQDMTSSRHSSPQARQKRIVEALKKDQLGTVYMTESNIVEVDRNMKEWDAHQELIKYLKGIEKQYAPDTIPDMDMSLCKA